MKTCSNVTVPLSSCHVCAPLFLILYLLEASSEVMKDAVQSVVLTAESYPSSVKHPRITAFLGN